MFKRKCISLPSSWEVLQHWTSRDQWPDKFMVTKSTAFSKISVKTLDAILQKILFE